MGAHCTVIPLFSPLQILTPAVQQWCQHAQTRQYELQPYQKDFKLGEYETFMDRYEAVVETVKVSGIDIGTQYELTSSIAFQGGRLCHA